MGNLLNKIFWASGIAYGVGLVLSMNYYGEARKEYRSLEATEKAIYQRKMEGGIALTILNGGMFFLSGMGIALTSRET